MHGGFDGWLACARNFLERENTDSLLQRPEIERREDRVSVARAHRLGSALHSRSLATALFFSFPRRTPTRCWICEKCLFLMIACCPNTKNSENFPRMCVRVHMRTVICAADARPIVCVRACQRVVSVLLSCSRPFIHALACAHACVCVCTARC